MTFRHLQRFAVFFIALFAALSFSACGKVSEIDLPPIPTYSDEIPSPARTSEKETNTPGKSAAESPVPSFIAGENKTDVPAPSFAAGDNTTEADGADIKSAEISEAAPTPDQESRLEIDEPRISISGETLPSDMMRFNIATLHGKVTTDLGYLYEVRAMLTDTNGVIVQECSFQPNAQGFSLAGTVNAELQFAILEPGEYVYQLTATVDYNGTMYDQELIFHSFKVFASQEEMNKDKLDPDSENAAEYTAKITQDTSNAGVIWNFLIVYLDNPYGAAGVLANIDLESGCNPIRVQGDFSEGYTYSQQYTELVDSGNINKDSFVQAIPGDGYGSGYGLCQWSFDRKAGLYDLAQERGTSVGDLDTQCIYLIMELERDYPDLSKLLKTTLNAREAANQFCFVFEQAGELGDRAGIAEDYLERFAS